MLRRRTARWIPGICAALIMCFLIGSVLLSDKRTEEYPIVFLGDSLIGNVWNDTGVTHVMERRLGVPVLKGALGGTTASFTNEELWASRIDTDLCLYELVQAVCYQDFHIQKAGIAYGKRYMDVNTQILNYFEQTIEQLSSTDFSKTDILLIEHGTNDYNKGRPLDNPSDKYDVTTFGGALRSSIALLQQTYPELRILLVTPVYCELGPEGIRKCYNTDYGGGYLQDYVEKEEQIAQEYGIEVIDTFHDSGIGEETADRYLEDKLHLSEEGRELIGNMIAEYLLEKG